jgi:hypothetical protein
MRRLERSPTREPSGKTEHAARKVRICCPVWSLPPTATSSSGPIAESGVGVALLPMRVAGAAVERAG